MSYSKSEIKEFKPQEKNGSKILNKNKFFSDFTSLMRNIEFKEFYNNYFKDRFKEIKIINIILRELI